MKYQDKSFTVGYGSEAYRKGWEETFGKSETPLDKPEEPCQAPVEGGVCPESDEDCTHCSCCNAEKDSLTE